MGWLKDRKQRKFEDDLEESLDAEWEFIKKHVDEQAKENPAQRRIAEDESTLISVPYSNIVKTGYIAHESVSRGVNLLVESLSCIDIDVKDVINPNDQSPLRLDPVHLRTQPREDRKLGDRRLQAKKLIKLLNYQPNPYEDKYSLFAKFWLDFFLYGNAFLHFDGSYLYHLSADQMEIAPSKKTFIREYVFDGVTHFPANQIIHIKDMNSSSVFVGQSRLLGACWSIDIMTKMSQFQQSFFKNGAILGLVLTSDNVLSPKVKAKVLRNWQVRFNPNTGGRRPAILDGGIKVDTVGISTYRDLDFDVGYENREKRVLQALGVPPVLLNSGNNANLRPNMKLLYELAVLPVFERFTKALEVYFGWDIEPVMQNIPALQPEVKERASSITSLVNSGVLTPNEARAELRRPPLDGDENNQVRIPQNIAGSAENPNVGGRPSSSEPEDN